MVQERGQIEEIGREGNNGLTLEGLSTRFDASERRVEEQLQSLYQVIENLGLDGGKNRDGGRNYCVNDLNLRRPIHPQDDGSEEDEIINNSRRRQ